MGTGIYSGLPFNLMAITRNAIFYPFTNYQVMKKWTEDAIKRTNLGYKSTLIGKSVLPKQMPIGLAFIVAYLSTQHIEFIPEHKFHPVRKFRFDVAVPSIKLAIEYEGIYSEKSRHTNKQGYSNDTAKYNLAVINGWKVLRYTADNYKDFINDFNEGIKQWK